MRIDLSILLRSLLSKEQLLLFKKQNARAFTSLDFASQQIEPEEIEEHTDGLRDHNFVAIT